MSVSALVVIANQSSSLVLTTACKETAEGLSTSSDTSPREPQSISDFNLVFVLGVFVNAAHRNATRFLLCFLPAVDGVLDDVIRVTEASAFATERERGVQRGRSSQELQCQEQEDEGEKEEQEWQDERRRMGMGKNTTSKSIEGGGGGDGNGNRYEEETKHGAEFYPIPVCIRGRLGARKVLRCLNTPIAWPPPPPPPLTHTFNSRSLT